MSTTKTPSKHFSKYLTHAINSSGQTVSIDSVPLGKECNCFCPACKSPLIAKNKGEKRVHHFAHQSGKDCGHAVESMLHILAKEKIREAFLTKDNFSIQFHRKSFCRKHNTCKYVRDHSCLHIISDSFNLKDFYDSCEQEITYDNIKRRSDLKIFSSKNPNKAPIYLEFCVTHASDTEKLHSGNKIIEIRIETEQDILELAQNGICESEPSDFYRYGYEEELPKIQFFGFKQEDENDESYNRTIRFKRFVLYRTGKSNFLNRTAKCNELTKQYPDTLLEVCIHEQYELPNIYKLIKYIAFQKFRIKNCTLCFNAIPSNFDGIKCRLYKQLNIPYEGIDTSRAIKCNHFRVKQQKIDSTLSEKIRNCCTVFE